MAEVFNKILTLIAFVEKTYKRNISGEEKHIIVRSKLGVMMADDDDYKAMEDYIDELIDIIVKIIKNKELIKLFKRNCAICF